MARLPLSFSSAKAFMKRHRRSLSDLSIVIATISVGLYLALEYDFFRHEGHETLQQETLELDEALLIGGLLALLLLFFAIRRHREQKREIARRTAAEKQIRVLAFQDTLTGLANRRQFDEALRAAIAAPPREGACHAVLVLDLNGFKQINDIHGHAVGDEVLTLTAQRLLSGVRDGDLVARLGGDEFAVLATHVMGPDAAANIGRRIIDELSPPLLTGEIRHLIASGIGVALIPFDAVTAEEVFRKADLALYRAKEERRSAVHFFEEVLDRRMREREWVERELRSAVVSGQIKALFEPTVDLRTRQITGFEALPHWLHPTAGPISPQRFIAIAEECGLIHEIMDHILRQASETAAQWPLHVRLSIDVLPVQLKDRSLAARILEILRETGLSPNRLEIEITEAALVRDLESAKLLLGTLRDEGVRIALDNFGTGYSSLYHLRNFKLDKIKIDSSFIRAMQGKESNQSVAHAHDGALERDLKAEQEESATIVRALVGLAHGLGLTIAAEGIEDPNQQSSLLLTGCEQGQGNLYSQPLSAEQTVDALVGRTA